MTKPLVKICGITNFADALFCASAGANFLGFIFYKKSPRFIEPLKAREIISKLPENVIPVGVFVNELRETINKIIAETRIRIIQLSGDESPEDCTGFALDVWKAFRFSNPEETGLVAKYQVSAALLDGYNKELYGGTGILADKKSALEIKKTNRLILAGGLNPGNIHSAIVSVEPYAVDVNSGIEFVPGKKNQNEVKRLFEEIHK